MRLALKIFLLCVFLTGCANSQSNSAPVSAEYQPAISTVTAIPTYTSTPISITTVAVTPYKIKASYKENQIYLEGFSDFIQSLTWSGDGKTLIIGDKYNGVVSFDTENKNSATNPMEPIWSIDLSPDKKILAVNFGGEWAGSKVSFIDLETGDISKTIDSGKPLDFLDTNGTAHIMNSSTGAIFAPDGKTFILNSGTQITLWDVASGTQAKELFKSEPNFLVLRLFLNPAKNTLLAIYRNILGVKGSERILVWDTNTWILKLTKNVDNDTFAELFGLSFSPDGNSYATASGDGAKRINIWNFNTFTKSKNFENLDELGLFHRDGIVSYALSGKYIAISGNGNINIYDTTTGKLIRHIISGFSERVLVFSSDETKLAVGGSEGGRLGVVMIWNWNQH
jgi:WD40 repeat protein